MCQGIHTGISHLFWRKTLYQIGVYKCDIRSDVKISQRIFYAGSVICDNRECSYLCCSSGSSSDSSKFCFLAQFRETERCDQILESNIRIFIKCPHCFCGIDRRTATEGNDPVRLEFLHLLSAFYNGLYRRIRLYAFKCMHFHSGFLQVSLNFLQKSLSFHRTAAYNEECAASFQIF